MNAVLAALVCLAAVLIGALITWVLPVSLGYIFGPVMTAVVLVVGLPPLVQKE